MGKSLIIFVTIVFASIAFAASPSKSKAQASKAAAATTPELLSQVQTTSVATITSQVLSILSQPTLLVNFTLNLTSATSGTTSRITEFEGRGSFPFKSDLILPLGEGTAVSSDAGLAPNLEISSKNLVLQFVSVKNKSGDINTTVNFFKATKPNQLVPLTVFVKSKDMAYLGFQLSNLTFVLKGLTDSAGKITVSGTCGIQQSVMDMTTLNPTWKTATCSYDGTYEFSGSKVNVNLHYNSLK